MKVKTVLVGLSTAQGFYCKWFGYSLQNERRQRRKGLEKSLHNKRRNYGNERGHRQTDVHINIS